MPASPARQPRWGAVGPRRQCKKKMTALFYLGRFAQLDVMWLLLVDLFTAGPFGPSPRLLALGVGVFIAGWALSRATKRSS